MLWPSDHLSVLRITWCTLESTTDVVHVANLLNHAMCDGEVLYDNREYQQVVRYYGGILRMKPHRGSFKYFAGMIQHMRQLTPLYGKKQEY